MFKTFIMTAAAALVATAAAAPAYAGIVKNGGGTNGREINGQLPNGYASQGTYPNGYSTQGTSTGVAGFVIDGIELPALGR